VVIEGEISKLGLKILNEKVGEDLLIDSKRGKWVSQVQKIVESGRIKYLAPIVISHDPTRQELSDDIRLLALAPQAEPWITQSPDCFVRVRGFYFASTVN
jgi:hypothetical protein